MARSDQLERLIGEVHSLVEAFRDFTRLYRRLNDVLYPNADDAASAMNVGQSFFRKQYRDQVGRKIGQSRSFYKSSLREREEQIDRELEVGHHDDAADAR